MAIGPAAKARRRSCCQSCDRGLAPGVPERRGLEPGTIVAALIAAANRDPDHFSDPERFDIGRRDDRQLSFGLGNHFCLGASLARMEAQVALGALLRRFPDFDGPPQLPAWKPSIVLRGPASLPVRLH